MAQGARVVRGLPSPRRRSGAHRYLGYTHTDSRWLAARGRRIAATPCNSLTLSSLVGSLTRPAGTGMPARAMLLSRHALSVAHAWRIPGECWACARPLVEEGARHRGEGTYARRAESG